MEIWKDIKGYEGKYQVSNLGKIKSLKRTHGLSKKIINKELIMKLSVSKQGYYLVNLRKNDKYQLKIVHRLVAEHFIENINNHPIVNHIDGNKQNNKVENLEWCSYSYNERHAYKTGIKKPWSKPIVQYDLDGNYIKDYSSAYEASRELNLNVANINSCCNNRKGHRTVGGYIFKFKDYELKEL